MELFNPTVSRPVSTSAVATDSFSAVLRNVPPDLQKTLSTGATIAAKVVVSSGQKMVQVVLAGQTLQLKLPDIKLPLLPNIITIKQQVGVESNPKMQIRDVPIQVKTESAHSVHYPQQNIIGKSSAISAGQVSSGSGTAVPSTSVSGALKMGVSQSLTAMNGSVILAEMIKPTAQAKMQMTVGQQSTQDVKGQNSANLGSSQSSQISIPKTSSSANLPTQNVTTQHQAVQNKTIQQSAPVFSAASKSIGTVSSKNSVGHQQPLQSNGVTVSQLNQTTARSTTTNVTTNVTANKAPTPTATVSPSATAAPSVPPSVITPNLTGQRTGIASLQQGQSASPVFEVKALKSNIFNNVQPMQAGAKSQSGDGASTINHNNNTQKTQFNPPNIRSNTVLPGQINQNNAVDSQRTSTTINTTLTNTLQSNIIQTSSPQETASQSVSSKLISENNAAKTNPTTFQTQMNRHVSTQNSINIGNNPTSKTNLDIKSDVPINQTSRGTVNVDPNAVVKNQGSQPIDATARQQSSAGVTQDKSSQNTENKSFVTTQKHANLPNQKSTIHNSLIQTYQQTQQNTRSNQPFQVNQFQQWTEAGQKIQLQIFDPRLTPTKQQNMMQGTVLQANKSGQTVVQTPVGRVALPLSQPLPEGTIVMLAEAETTGETAIRNRFGALESLFASVPNASVAQAAIPKPNKQISSSLLFFLMALRQGGGLQSLWDGTTRGLMQSQQEKLSAAEEEFVAAQPAPIQADGAWQSYSLPLQVGGEIVKLLFYWRGDHGGSEQDTDQENSVFAIEGVHGDVGRFRLDGQFSRPNLHIQWASDRPLSPTKERELTDLYHQYSDLFKINGQIQFYLLGDRPLWMDNDTYQEQKL